MSIFTRFNRIVFIVLMLCSLSACAESQFDQDIIVAVTEISLYDKTAYVVTTPRADYIIDITDVSNPIMAMHTAKRSIGILCSLQYLEYTGGTMRWLEQIHCPTDDITER